VVEIVNALANVVLGNEETGIEGVLNEPTQEKDYINSCVSSGNASSD